MTKPPTVYDVAHHAGVSIATVSRVLSRPDDVKPATRDRVLASVGELGYVPSGAARGLAARRTGVIGLFFQGLDAMDDLGDIALEGDEAAAGGARIVRDIPERTDTRTLNLYFDEVLRGCELESWRSGFALLVGVGRGSTATQTVRDMAGRVDGLMVLAGSTSEEELARLSRHVPIVVMAGPRRGDDLDHVSVSNAEGMRTLTAHLIDDLGARELEYVAGSLGSPDDAERWSGFRAALADRSLEAPEEPTLRGDFTREGGRRVGRELFRRDGLPRAVVCANDQMALGVIDAARIAGVAVPEELIVTGFDGIDAGRLSAPRLTTVRQPMETLGRVSVQALARRLAEPKLPAMSVRLPVEVVLRESSESSVAVSLP
ncbi:transcriptional regulator, LacI family [Plantibacter flavus]|uniref:LacI family transcriptional regulator n=1 Tax=Plantibacter flavus TaxID=150123 RepID=A0A3N2BZ61_9MICO|nr:LacI family DNA-binding transcriptional regulator [Plantibacter flavus]ROR80531.1 LacI family transcriptional regulator [Plantibacter flavus]SMG33526.1 transcriptional regulator, LacI family [Plantibacter flavus]